MKLQTVDAQGQVLEQLAFTDLQMNAPVRMKKLAKLMNDTRGYEVHHAVLNKTTPEAARVANEGRGAGLPVHELPHPRACTAAPQGPHAMQCVYSDGLASVSLFVEPQGADRRQADAGLVSSERPIP